jgi:hypothetical protein
MLQTTNLDVYVIDPGGQSHTNPSSDQSVGGQLATN